MPDKIASPAPMPVLKPIEAEPLMPIGSREWRLVELGVNGVRAWDACYESNHRLRYSSRVLDALAAMHARAAAHLAFQLFPELRCPTCGREAEVRSEA